MNIDQDKLPNNLAEAVQMLMDGISHDDRKDLDEMMKDPSVTAGFHMGIGRYLRNSWNLWEDSPITRWFIAELKICHADDMSAIILEAFAAAYRGVPYDPAATVIRFHAHWIKQRGPNAVEAMIEDWKQYHKRQLN